MKSELHWKKRKVSPYLKNFEAIIKLGGPPIVKNSTLISIDDLESDLSKLNDKQDREFDILLDFSEENIKTWTVSYVNFNNDILVFISQGREELVDVK